MEYSSSSQWNRWTFFRSNFSASRNQRVRRINEQNSYYKMQTRNGNYEVVFEMWNYYFSLRCFHSLCFDVCSVRYIFYSRALELCTQKCVCVCGERERKKSVQLQLQRQPNWNGCVHIEMRHDWGCGSAFVFTVMLLFFLNICSTRFVMVVMFLNRRHLNKS